jgi:hypothetical protein
MQQQLNIQQQQHLQHQHQQQLYQFQYLKPQVAGLAPMHFWPPMPPITLEGGLSRYDPKGSKESLSTLESNDDSSPIYKTRKSRKKDRSMSIGSQGERVGLASHDSCDSIVSLGKDDGKYGHYSKNVDKKRQDRNTREQQRSFKISKQIEHLKGILESSGVKVKSSKYSVLSSAADYLKQLQTQSNMMIEELQKVKEKCDSLQNLDAPKANQAPMSRNISNSPNSPVPRETTIALPRSVPGLSSSNLRPGIPSHETSLYNPEESSAPIALGTLDGRIFDCSDSNEFT